MDDGTCNYIADTSEETGLSEDLRGYVTKTLSNVWSHNFKGDDTEPKDWGSTGYSYRGQRVSQRDIMRLVSHSALMTHLVFLRMLCSKTSILLYREIPELHRGINVQTQFSCIIPSAVSDEEQLAGLISNSATGFTPESFFENWAPCSLSMRRWSKEPWMKLRRQSRRSKFGSVDNISSDNSSYSIDSWLVASTAQ